MKILFVVPYIPNLIRVRPYNLIRFLAARGHQITLLTLWTEEADWADIEHLRQICYRVEALPMPRWRSLLNCLLAVPTQKPFQSVFSWQPQLMAHLNGDASFDVVHVEHLRGVRYALHVKAHTPVPVVWDSVDCITHLFRQTVARSKGGIRRWRSQLDLSRTARYEGWLSGQFDHMLVTSQVDKMAFQSLSDRPADGLPITVLENGVDLDYFKPETAVGRKPATLVMTGKMSYHANIAMTLHLVENIMPHIWHHQPETKLWIVGKDPATDIKALGEHPQITVTGFVNDIRPYLHQATMALAPITYGAGVQNKVLEAMACATPVVTTAPAVSALKLVSGRDVLVADDPATFAQTVLSLIDDPDKQQQIGQSGYHYVQTHHYWPDIAARLEGIYHAAIHNSKLVSPA